MTYNKKNSSKCNPEQKQKNKRWCTFGCIYSIVDKLSIFCTFVGISIFLAIFCGLTEILDYRKSKMTEEYGHYCVIASVIFFLVALVLSFFKEDSNDNDSTVLQITEKRTEHLEDNHSNGSTSKLKNVRSNIEIKQKQGTVTEKNKPSNISSKTASLSARSKEEIGRKTAQSNTSKNVTGTPKKTDVGRKNLSSKVSPNTIQHIGISKQKDVARNTSSKVSPTIHKLKKDENPRTVPPAISSKPLQQAGISKKIDNARNFSPNTSWQNLQQSKLEDKAKALSPIISSKPLQEADTSKQRGNARTFSPIISRQKSSKTQSLNLNETISTADKQLDLCKRKSENPFAFQSLEKSAHQNPNSCDSVQTGNNSWAPGAFEYSPWTHKFCFNAWAKNASEFNPSGYNAWRRSPSITMEYDQSRNNSSIHNTSEHSPSIQNASRYDPSAHESSIHNTLGHSPWIINASRNSSVTELSTTQRMTFYPWGATREEICTLEKTFFNYPRYSVRGNSPVISPSIWNLDNDQNASMPVEFDQNEITDLHMQEKFESMNFLD